MVSLSDQATPPTNGGARRPAARQNGDGEKRNAGQWYGRNSDGEIAGCTTQAAALEFACPPDAVVFVKHGEKIPREFLQRK